MEAIGSGYLEAEADSIRRGSEGWRKHLNLRVTIAVASWVGVEESVDIQPSSIAFGQLCQIFIRHDRGTAAKIMPAHSKRMAKFMHKGRPVPASNSRAAALTPTSASTARDRISEI